MRLEATGLAYVLSPMTFPGLSFTVLGFDHPRSNMAHQVLKSINK